MEQKTIVLTMYGTGEAINNVTVTLFYADGYDRTTVQDYCHNINELELKDDNWIYAFTVKENEKFRLEKPKKFTGLDVLCSLDDHAIQMVIREINHFVLPQALVSADKKTLSAVIRNMSKRAAKMLIENMEYQRRIPKKDIQEAQKKVVDVIQHLAMAGQITVPKFGQNEAGGALSQDEIAALLAGAD
jgi:hypothetical protein